MLDQIHNRLPALLVSLNNLDATSQYDAVVAEVREAFGRFDQPEGNSTHRWELELHGICADGANEEEAIANWKRLARQNIRATDMRPDCPFNGQRPAQ